MTDSTNATETQTCRGCECNKLIQFFDVAEVPASVGTLSATQADARNANKGSMQLVACPACGLIQNRKFDVDVAGFQPGYEVSLFHTPTFRAYIQSVVDRLIQDYELHNKRILEIGCGGGDFLKLICEQGGNQGIGIDPTIARHSSHRLNGTGHVEFIPGYFGSEHQKHLGDFICCLSVFEDIPQPLQFLKLLRSAIGKKQIPVYFEVFNGYRAIEEQEVWSIHYEQCNYFRLDTLVSLFERAGFSVLKSGECYQGDQYIFVEAMPADTECHQTSSLSGFEKVVQDFGARHKNAISEWNARFLDWKQRDKQAVLWGSGGTGISFLTTLSNSSVVGYVVDVNPDRQNCFIPLTGQQIVGPEQLPEIAPDYVIISNPLYETEIRKSLRELNVHCDVMIA